MFVFTELGKKAFADERFKKLEKEMIEISTELARLDPSPTARGSVWLYLREVKSVTDK